MHRRKGRQKGLEQQRDDNPALKETASPKTEGLIDLVEEHFESKAIQTEVKYKRWVNNRSQKNSSVPFFTASV
ncbi:hypothetical protein KIL84_003053, partial [Mauremys mutica]